MNEEGTHEFMSTIASVSEPSIFENSDDYQLSYSNGNRARPYPPWIRHSDQSETYDSIRTRQEVYSASIPGILTRAGSHRSSMVKDHPSRYQNAFSSDTTPSMSQAPSQYGDRISHSHQRPEILANPIKRSHHIYKSSKHDLSPVQQAYKPLQYIINDHGGVDITTDVVGRPTEHPNRHDTRHINKSRDGRGNNQFQLSNGCRPCGYDPAAQMSMSKRSDTMPIDPRLLDGITGIASPCLLAFDTSAFLLPTPPETRQSNQKRTFSDFRRSSSPEVENEMANPSYTEESTNKCLLVGREFV